MWVDSDDYQLKRSGPIAVFTDFKVGVKNGDVFDANFEIGENSNNCIKTDCAWSVFEKK